MCGITGILSTDLNKITLRNSILKMIPTLNHRGPDGWGIYCSDNIALGHTRLSIIDLNSGDQPMRSGRFVIICNGEIFNYLELKAELEIKGVIFNTNSDTEVVLKAFEYYGTDCFQKLNGQFAILIWDTKAKRLIAARDRFGIRPLFILKHNSEYYFTSEIKAFDTINNFRRSFNMENLFELSLLWSNLEDRTNFNNIRSLIPGTYECYEPGKQIIRKRYYEIGESNGQSPVNFHQAKEEFNELLMDSVRLRLRSDVPVGTYLSGGLDSSVITYLTSLNKGYDKLTTFSVSFKDKEFDESEYQEEMLKKLKSSHYSEEITYNKIDTNFMNVAYHFEQPVFRTAPVPLYLLSNKVKEKGIKVILTGEGADEILFGYDSYKELKLLKEYKQSPDVFSKVIPILYPHLKHYQDPKQFSFLRMYYEDFLNDFENDLAGLNIRVSNNKIMENLFKKDHALCLSKKNLIHKIKSILPNNYNNWDILQKQQFLDMKTLLNGYLLSSQGDRMSLAHGIEGRYPFLDHRLVEKLFYFNSDYKLNNYSQKYLLKETYKGHIPDSIINRPKQPYTAPDIRSFIHKNGRMTEKTSYLLSMDIIRKYDIFNERMVSRFINKFRKGLPDKIGYRDNMLISFILSTQAINYWILNPKQHNLDMLKKKVDISD